VVHGHDSGTVTSLDDGGSFTFGIPSSPRVCARPTSPRTASVRNVNVDESRTAGLSGTEDNQRSNSPSPSSFVGAAGTAVVNELNSARHRRRKLPGVKTNRTHNAAIAAAVAAAPARNCERFVLECVLQMYTGRCTRNVFLEPGLELILFCQR